MLVKSTGTFRALRLWASRSPASSPGSITAASTGMWSTSPPGQTIGSCPSRRTTNSRRALISACGSQMRTRATPAESTTDAGNRRAGWYEPRMNARLRVLVVDDDGDIRLLLRELLERAGYAVDEAEDGRTALRT